eukprot:TRINITY_DN1495_c1_g1_i1.p1 TRINITY_DN1495_c1_g1~~TRINITY_DN1495_c1_g1_i1.p1  ORF type:complete len:157 (+),score=12.78 TRINITY_DN1495_c1_g1_i1:40-471(+)
MAAAGGGFWGWWSRFESRVFGPYLGVPGGVIFRSPRAQAFFARHPKLEPFNNVLLVAPTMKWSLALVPLYGAIQGKPTPEDIDLNQAAALTFTGAVWTYYSTLVVPKAYMLMAVNSALFAANGWNVFRRLRYDQQKQNARTVD